MDQRTLLESVGRRVRNRREHLGFSRRELSKRSGVSERFLAQLERGAGNISLVRFAEVARALGMSAGELLSQAESAKNALFIALLGIRGAGKSTVGERLAEILEIDFVEVDGRIEQAAGLSLTEIFELHGEAYYRRLEHDALTNLFRENRAAVLATGGSIVTDSANFALLRERAVTFWLRASAEDHWNRVIQQGDARPMAKNPQAFSELQSLVASRAPLYATADYAIETGRGDVSAVVSEITSIVYSR